MKKLAAAVFILMATTIGHASDKKEPETKRVCVTERDSKGSPKETCKTIRVHKKLEPQAAPKQ